MAGFADAKRIPAANPKNIRYFALHLSRIARTLRIMFRKTFRFAKASPSHTGNHSMKLSFCLSASILVSLLGPTPASADPPYIGAEVYQLVSPFDPGFGLVAGTEPYGRPVSGTQVVGSSFGSGVVWNGPAGAATSLYHPAFTNIEVSETDGLTQVGFGKFLGSNSHALLWHGTEESVVDLHPTGLPGYSDGSGSSYAFGVHGNQQVGYGEPFFVDSGAHALLWNRQSAIDLHPTNLGLVLNSFAAATDGVHQVGVVHYVSTPFINHAVMWSGSANSAIDLHGTALSSFGSSVAYGVGGGQQVGFGTAGHDHAFVWSGSADSVVDLHPTSLSQYLDSKAFATNGSVQIGEGITAAHNQHALLWKNSAASVINLHDLLPSGYSNSLALSIDAQGIIYGLAKDASFNVHLVKWTPAPVPEPTTLWIAGVAFAVSICQRQLVFRRACLRR